VITVIATVFLQTALIHEKRLLVNAFRSDTAKCQTGECKRYFVEREFMENREYSLRQCFGERRDCLR
jgi:hypothetical protein